jgi:tripartite-type tricarboxylate transporter receptor subunit TctC
VDVSYGVWYAVCAPAGTAPDVVATLERAFLKGLEQPELKAFMEKSGWVLSPMGARETAGLFEKEDTRLHVLLKELGLTTK